MPSAFPAYCTIDKNELHDGLDLLEVKYVASDTKEEFEETLQDRGCCE